MRPLVLCAWAAALATTGLAREGLRIQEIGLEGYYSPEPSPTQVEVLLINPDDRPQTIELSLRIIDLEPHADSLEHVFTQTLNVGPKEQRAVNIPVQISWGKRPAIVAEARDSAGTLLSREQRPLDRALSEHLVAIVCMDDAVCRATQTEITFAGTQEEQTEKGKSLKFVAVRNAPRVWWGYAPADLVVLAAPLAGLRREQLEALEGYLRQGGRLVLIEDQLHDGAYLAPYRIRPPTGRPQIVGMGKLYRVARLRSPEFGSLFSGASLERLVEYFSAISLRSELSWVRRRLATSFRFPGLGWLLAWIGAYIAAVGAINFAVLRRLGRREWGWVSMPVIALLFAIGMYVTSAAKRPKTFGADEVALYWMDDASPTAAAEMSLRVSAPYRKTVRVNVPSEGIFVGEQNPGWFEWSSRATIRSSRSDKGWKIRVGPPWQVELPLLHWSFHDLDFRDMKSFPGSIHRGPKTRLRNETGRDFREAIYVDKKKVYFLRAFGRGTEVDLAETHSEALKENSGRVFWPLAHVPTPLTDRSRHEEGERRVDDPEKIQKQLEELRKLSGQPFELVELLRGWPEDGGHVFDYRSAVFFGVAEESVLGASLEGVPFTKKHYAVTIVSFAPEK